MSLRKFGSREGMEEWSRKIHDIMDEMHRRVFFEYRATDTWQPRVNIYETRAGYHICVDLAGLAPDDLCVECVNTTRLRLSGQRARPRAPRLKGPFSVEVMEIDEGLFAREIDFREPLEIEAVEIAYERGYLWITLPKTATT